MEYTVGWQFLNMLCLSRVYVCAHTHARVRTRVCVCVCVCAAFQTSPQISHMASGRMNEQTTKDD